MDAALMLKTAAVLLGLTAVGGLIMAFIRFSGADRPTETSTAASVAWDVS